MDTKTNDGGLAFPWGENGTVLGGLTKREYAAVHVQVPSDLSMAWGELMIGPYPSRHESGGVKYDEAGMRWWAAVEAKYRAVYADALLAELAKEQP